MSVDYADYQTPQANATAISITGVPLLANPASLYSVSSQVVTAGASATLNNAASSASTYVGGYLSYELRIALTVNALSLNPFMAFTLAWTDTPGGNVLYREEWIIPGNSAGSLECVGTGPVRANYLTVSVTNEDASNSMTITQFVLYGNSRPAVNINPDLRNTINAAAPPTFVTSAAGRNWDGVIGWFSSTLAASGTRTLMAGLYNGPVIVAITVAGTGPSLSVAPQAWIPGQGLGQIGQSVVVGTSALSQQLQVNCPRSPLVLALTNNNGTNAVTYTISVIAANQF